jgi:beta-ketodecanoyl-[acyl-carrier-protein] synthase
MPAAITATGVWVPETVLTNDQVVAAYNAHAARWNAAHAEQIAAGALAAKAPSSSDFIVQASGIERRHVVTADGLLDPDRMYPRLPPRPDDAPSLTAEAGVAAATRALAKAGRDPGEVDAILCAASIHERAYPAVAVEMQALLGTRGFAFDMNVACASAAFAIQTARDMIASGSATKVLIVSPEITSGHLEWRDRDCHFIFGDVATAVLVEDQPTGWQILSTRCATRFSNNIRNNNGYLRPARDQMEDRRDMRFMQNGRKVFKEVLPLVAAHVEDHLSVAGVAPDSLSRLWLHQANKAMNDYLGRRILGRDPAPGEQPNILQDFANTSSAGSVIAFDRHSDDLPPGATGLLCAFGAGYSVGSVLLRRF